MKLVKMFKKAEALGWQFSDGCPNGTTYSEDGPRALVIYPEGLWSVYDGSGAVVVARGSTADEIPAAVVIESEF